MDNNGKQWTTMENNGQQWKTMDNNGKQWITMDNYRQQSKGNSDAVLFTIHCSSSREIQG